MSMVIAVMLTVPGFILRLFQVELDPAFVALITGAAILGASFLLLWACETAQKDISQALALAVVALIAVLPEYAVDMYFTWQAGQNPQGDYAHYAIANMTGANRLIIGIAWAMIVGIFWLKTKRPVELESGEADRSCFPGNGHHVCLPDTHQRKPCLVRWHRLHGTFRLVHRLGQPPPLCGV